MSGDVACSLTVISELFQDTYLPVVHVGDDLAIPLPTLDHAQRYAQRVVEAAERAVYDAAVWAQMQFISNREATAAAHMIGTLRDRRQPLDDSATEPLRFEPVLLSKTALPEVHVHVRGKAAFALDPDAAIGHAAGVLRAVVVAANDALYRDVIGTHYAAGDNRAMQVVDNLRAFRPDYEQEQT